MNLLRKLLSFFRAIVGDRVSSEEADRRLTICVGCPHLVRRGRWLYCGACGCGFHYLARLNGTPSKVGWAEERCPLQPPRW